MLFYAGVTTSIGDVDKGTTVTDYMEMEKERGITIVSAAISFEWLNHRFNLVDTPGHVDFTVEVERSVRVLDGAVAILDAVAGVQAQTETVWRQANRYQVPRVAFINKYDREGASMSRTVTMMKERLGAFPLPVQLPIGVGVGFRGVIDLIRQEAIEWPEDDGSRPRTRPLTSAEKEEAAKGRLALMEGLCEVDEAFLDAYVGGDKKVEDVTFVNSAIRRATITMKAVPCLVGAAFRNKGVQCVMDSIVLYLPSPVDVAHPPTAVASGSGKTVQLTPQDKNEMVCLAWKVVHDHRMGLITYCRVISGILRAGVMLQNTSCPTVGKERLNKLVLLKAADMEQVVQVTAGNIAAIIGLKNVSTGDTLMEASNKVQMVLPRVTIPPPVFFRSIEPQSLAEQDKMDSCLQLLHKEDPSFQITVDKDTGQTLVGGMGELHLEYILDRLLTHYKVKAVVGDIMIAYRCAPKLAVEEEVDMEHVYDSGTGKIVTTHIKMTLACGELEDALKHVRVEDGRSVKWAGETLKPKELLAYEAIVEGFNTACNRVSVSGHPMVNVSAIVHSWRVEGDVGAGDALSVLKACAERAVRSMWSEESQLSTLEPAMSVEVRVESEFVGLISADLTSARRGVIGDVRVEGRDRVLTATVPLKEMIGYSPAFRQKTAGKGSYTMEFQQFVVVAGNTRQ